MENHFAIVEKQKQFFRTNQTKDYHFRINALQKLRSGIKMYEQHFIQSLKADLNKSEFEAYMTEIGMILHEIRFTLKYLKQWMKPEKVKTPITHIGSTSTIYSEPYGVALIISPWNYPLQLAMAPLIGAIAAGNCAIIKPSELTPETSKLLAAMIAKIFPEEYITVIEGGVETSQTLLSANVDYIFFTGSVHVGKMIMAKAAEQLIPVTLELGGKSPCIVHEDAHIPLAAKRIAWGKYINAGQTCVAPDYLYVHQTVKDEFVDELKQAVNVLYGEMPINNPNFTRIVSKRHFDRLTSFIDSEKVVFGGKINEAELIIEPTALMNVTWEDTVMEDEIFGPILPILEYRELDEVITGITRHPNPLALYLFSESKRFQNRVLNSVSFGGGCVNDTIYHLSSPYLPFGGVRTSGIGAYHGKGSFDTFSHKKSILKQTTKFDLPFRYPNVKDGLRRIKYFLK